jgi:hypothetical protein
MQPVSPTPHGFLISAMCFLAIREAASEYGTLIVADRELYKARNG